MPPTTLGSSWYPIANATQNLKVRSEIAAIALCYRSRYNINPPKNFGIKTLFVFGLKLLEHKQVK